YPHHGFGRLSHLHHRRLLVTHLDVCRGLVKDMPPSRTETIHDNAPSSRRLPHGIHFVPRDKQHLSLCQRQYMVGCSAGALLDGVVKLTKARCAKGGTLRLQHDKRDGILLVLRQSGSRCKQDQTRKHQSRTHAARVHHGRVLFTTDTSKSVITRVQLQNRVLWSRWNKALESTSSPA